MQSQQTSARWWQRAGQRFASSAVGSLVFSYTLHHIDKGLLRLSGGRVSIPRLVAGLPVVAVTTVGAKSGKERTLPLLGLEDGDDYVLIASNWGGDSHPAWSYNLKANPEVTLTHDDHTGRYRGREVTGAERDRYWNRAVEVYPGYDAYRRRAGDRRIPVLVLTPLDE